MKRRQFIQTAGAATALCAGVSNAQSLVQTLGDAALRLNPLIQPEERVEKRVYPHSESNSYIWKEITRTFSNDDPTAYGLPRNEKGQYFHKRIWCFVEALATDEKILLTGGGLHRRDIQQTTKSGTYWYFGNTVLWLSLPRRTSKSPNEIQDRYAYPELTSVRPNNGIKGGFLSIDFRKIKIVEGNHIYSPTHEVYHELNESGGYPVDAPALLRPITKSSIYPLNYSSMSIQNILYFDIPQRPIRFTLELPPMIIQGIEVPLPTCYFEPFDTATDKWV